MEVIEQYRATLGATELRTHVAGHGAELAGTGLRLALEDQDPGRVLGWSERWRSGALMSRPVRPPDDEGLAADLAELRRVAAAIDEAVLARRDPSALWRQQVRLEESVRRRCRQAPGDGADTGEGPPAVEALQAALGDRALVEIVEVDGRHHAVVVTPGGVTLRSLGSPPVVEAERSALQFALRRLARPDRSPASADAAARAAAHAAARLDGELLGPLADDIGERALVIVPTGTLHSLPWSILPSCRRRPVSVAPSSALWHRASRAEPSPAAAAAVVLVAGPRLAHAATEVEGLARRYPSARAFLGDAAEVAPVLSVLDGAALAHVAAHGRFRADNPLFSCLELFDGPLTVYDLESLGSAPRVLVLSA
ncbi:MAG: CHAT domain-containing protein, partial [Actinobacteria bacterium]|nr:CHAT domain-containing protein [Actinomycetota bacterium]